MVPAKALLARSVIPVPEFRLRRIVPLPEPVFTVTVRVVPGPVLTEVTEAPVTVGDRLKLLTAPPFTLSEKVTRN